MRRLSFSVVTYNNENEIKSLLRNLVTILQNKVSYDIYVIDNASQDRTADLVKKESNHNKSIHLIKNKKNLGFGQAHNKILPLIQTDYHFVINPDISIRSYSEIQKMVNFMDKQVSVGLLSPEILNSDGTIQRLFKRTPSVYDLLLRFISPNLFPGRQNWFVHLNSGYNNICHIDYASGCFMLFRSSVFERIQGFDSRYFMYMEDADITREVNSVSNSIFFPEAKITHSWQRNNHRKLKYILISVKSMCLYFNKWGWKFW